MLGVGRLAFVGWLRAFRRRRRSWRAREGAADVRNQIRHGRSLGNRLFGAGLALDFFTADLLNCTKVYVLAVIEHGTRRVRILGATQNPVQS